MKWDEVKENLRALVEKLSGVVTTLKDKPRPFMPMDGLSEGCACTINFPTVVGLGWDEFRLQAQDGDGNLPVNQNGIRQFTCSVLIESLQQDDLNSASHYLEKLREGLERPQIADVLREACGVYIYSVSASRDSSYSMDDHIVAANGLDLMCTIMINVAQDDIGTGNGLDPVSYIGEVVANGTVYEPGGSASHTTAATITLDVKLP